MASKEKTVAAIDPPMTPKERAAWRRMMAYLSSATALAQAVEDPGVGSMASEIQQIITESKDRIVQAYRDAKA